MGPLIGLDEQLNRIKEYLKNYRNSKPLLLVGSTGTGKTSSVMKVAEELGYKVWVIDCSMFGSMSLEDSVDNLLSKIRLKSIIPTILLIENINLLDRGLFEKLVKAIKNRSIPVIATSDIPINTDEFEVVNYYKPRARDLMRLVREVAKDRSISINYEALNTRDYRQALLSIYGSMGYDESKSITRELEESLKTGEYGDYDVGKLIYLLDSAHLNFYGNDLYWFVRSIVTAERVRDMEVLKGFRSEKPRIVSYFYTKLRLVKG